MFDSLIPLVLFAVVAVGTPGPNNAMLLASGANFGIRRGLPHYFGVNIGFAVMVFVVAAGLGATLLQFPVFAQSLKIAGIAYLLYLAYRIATADRAKARNVEGRPITFVEAALFQWVNPKAWIMATSASVTYATGFGGPIAEATLLATVFFICGSPFSGMWLVGGAWLARFLSSARRRRFFNRMMALLLVLSLVPVVADLLAIF